MKYPIVIEGDWLQLVYEEANSPEEALTQAVTRYVESVDEIELKIDPLGVTGQWSPIKELRIYYDDGSIESTWTIPDIH
jgi:hypothetical protein